MDYTTAFPKSVCMSFLMLFAIGNITFATAQTKESKRRISSEYSARNLSSVSAKFVKEFDAKQIKLNAYAKANGLKLSEKLATGEDVSLVDIGEDGTPLYYSTFSDNTSAISRANTLYEGGLLDLGLSGTGMQVGVWDSGAALPTHQEFNSRATIADEASIISDHATMVLGTMISSGIKSKAKGVAYNATAVTNDWSADKVEVTAAAADGLLLSNHSYGIQPNNVPDWYFGAYIQVSQDWDEIMYNAPYYLMVTAAGNAQSLKYNDTPIYGKNSDGFDLLLGFSTSKNGINVAAVDTNVDNDGNLKDAEVATYSSLGPIDDGRIKPDIAGCGANIYSSEATDNSSYDTYTGTSMAAPGITSTMLLLQEYYSKLNSTFMKAATLKGLVLHSADDVNEKGPDYKMGWGVINAKNAAEIITNDEFTSIIAEESLAEGENYTFTVDAKDNETLLASISWTDPAGTYINKGELNNTTAALVNDLDIRITDENNNEYFPWKLNAKVAGADATKGDNLVDPFEKIEIENASGTYTITVSHKGSITNDIQNFSLIVSNVSLTACTAEAPEEIGIASVDETSIMVDWKATEDSFYEVEYKEENSEEWTTLFPEENMVQLEGLTLGKAYEVQVRTNCSMNIFSDFSMVKSFVFNGLDTDLAFELTKEELAIQKELKYTVYPNPTVEQISVNGELSENAYYSIISSSGTVLKNGKVDNEAIEVNSLSSGLYSLTIFEDGEQHSMKFIKN
ncbi:S8 family serine peptidase [Cellulophaga baltica]|uniref:S8 family serine peptidase n=1 Tax=Cellulophaga TaxID=104264 RepID=UPI001C06AF4B|nr:MULTISPECIES: S8 family serine peptidase [Cellulophaga]MBU2997588.1 S8 family serine peptidase [Cellulophaga baltica]MDO6768983.1 S8 family serine peptidase [Cellulophaga sp. 1_MG-2023]